MIQKNLQYFPLGDQAITVKFENQISVSVSQRVYAYVDVVKSARICGVKLVIPTYNTVTIRYDPIVISYDEIFNELKRLECNISDINVKVRKKEKVFHFPAVYEGAYAPDLEFVAEKTGLSTAEVIRLHSSTTYIVYMLGFTAGFPYCGDMDKRLSLPRRETPRLTVPAGNIAIVKQETIIHPIQTPTGWHSIAWTPMNTFNPSQDPPSLISAGDYIKFEPISIQEAEKWDPEKQREWNAKWNVLK